MLLISGDFTPKCRPVSAINVKEDAANGSCYDIFNCTNHKSSWSCDVAFENIEFDVLVSTECTDNNALENIIVQFCLFSQLIGKSVVGPQKVLVKFQNRL